MSLIERIRVVGEEMTALAHEGDEAAFSAGLDALKTAAERIGKAWSGSWLGYQANVYYQGLNPVPAGAQFSQEWGLHEHYANDTVGDWEPFTHDEVIEAIEKAAGGPDMPVLLMTAREAAVRAMDGRATLVALLAGLNRETALDDALAGMRKEVEAVRMVDADELVNRWNPRRQVVTRDMLAVNQGSQAPGHKTVLARVASFRCPFDAALELARLARDIARHAEALGMGKQPVNNKAQPLHVFIGHGRSPAWRELKDYVKDTLGLLPDEFNRVSVAGIPTIDRLKQMLDESSIALLVMTAEDERQDGVMQARMNVIHEVGLFQGRLGFNRAIVLLEEGCAEFTNIAGLGQLRFPPGRISACFHEVQAVLVREGLLAGR
jgi:hypothetical protein